MIFRLDRCRNKKAERGLDFEVILNENLQICKKSELDKFGWQFNHIHLEILKHPPRPLKPTAQTPYRRYGTYSLECYTEKELDRYYYNPIEFLKARWTQR